MKPGTLKRAIDSIRPDTSAKNAMLRAILASSSPKKPVFPHPVSALLAVFCLMVISGFLVWFSSLLQVPADTPMVSPAPSTSRAALAVITNEFEWDGRSYIKSTGTEGIPQTADSSQIGANLTTIQNSIDTSLIGCDVYEYLPTACDAVVAVLRNGIYEIFTFRSFESYDSNIDEDANAYLLLYGIFSPDDLKKIEIFDSSFPSGSSAPTAATLTITDPDDLKEFYEQFSILEDSSDLYFQQLNFHGSNSGVLSSQISPASFFSGNDSPSQPGTTALDNGKQIRIYAANGLSFETWYYPNIGFLSRYQLSKNFISWLESHISPPA